MVCVCVYSALDALDILDARMRIEKDFFLWLLLLHGYAEVEPKAMPMLKSDCTEEK